MPQHPVVALPVDDRRTSSRFYRGFLGQDPPGEPQDDGEPEPLTFEVDGLHLMLVPRDGFQMFVVGEQRPVAERGTSEVVLSRGVPSEDDVERLSRVAVEVGGELVAAPERKPWGYLALVADPDGHLWQLIAD